MAAFLIANSLEFSLRFSSLPRAIIFFSFLLLSLFTIYKWILDPAARILSLKKGISEEEMAKNVGRFFPEVKDKLLNLLQLQKQTADNALIVASINQKSESVVSIPFGDAIDYKENVKYLKYLLPPVLILLILLIVAPGFISTSTKRIVQFNKEFVPEAPFTFLVEESNLLAFKNEDFQLTASLQGEAIPGSVYLYAGGRKVKMIQREGNVFSFTFPKIQNDKEFYLEGAGFKSASYSIKVVSRPNLKNFNVNLKFPNYLKKSRERLSNVGNLDIPEGTLVGWEFYTLQTDKLQINFLPSEEAQEPQQTDNQLFEYERRFRDSQEYELSMENEYSKNRDLIRYHINVIKDQYPNINLNIYQDTTLYNFIVLAGNISDDYGLTNLSVSYQVTKEAESATDFVRQNIPLTGSQASQSFYHQWNLSELGLEEGDKLNYYLTVSDNDGVNGSKSTKTGVYVFSVPTKKEIKEDLEATSKQTESQIEETLQSAQELQEKIEEAKNRLMGKKQLDWQDEKLLKELMEQREELNQALEELKKQNEANNLKRDRFSEQSEKLQEKVDQLQQLIDELLDEETKKLYEELQKLLEEQNRSEDVQNLLDKLDNKQENLEEELERTLELFKRMQFENKLEETINELQELAEEQEDLSEETGDKSNDLEDIKEQQEEINQEFQEFEESMKELQELNQGLEDPESMDDSSQEQQEIKEDQEQSSQSLQNNKRKKAQQSQKGASNKMKKLSKKLEQMQSNMEVQMMQENLDNLRDIVHNLIKLSVDQEQLMKDFREINQSDPRFIDFSQQQLKLKDDAKIVEDSLLSLANRVFQIQSFITREVGAMNDHMDASIKALRDRNRNVIPLTTSKQQFAMTSMNNLALLLDDVMQQMQQALADAMGNPKKGQPSNQNMPSMSELQKQLNDRIQDLKQSGKSGRELSEELSKLAAEQERIRRALQDAEEKLNQGKGSGGLEQVIEKMEDTEVDLVNKQITKETIKRQKEILTRLLEAEDSMRERELEEKREAETANPYENLVPKAFEEYFKTKEKEIELLKTVPPKLYPYYKQEVSEYFKRIGSK